MPLLMHDMSYKKQKMSQGSTSDSVPSLDDFSSPEESQDDSESGYSLATYDDRFVNVLGHERRPEQRIPANRGNNPLKRCTYKSMDVTCLPCAHGLLKALESVEYSDHQYTDGHVLGFSQCPDSSDDHSIAVPPPVDPGILTYRGDVTTIAPYNAVYEPVIYHAASHLDNSKVLPAQDRSRRFSYQHSMGGQPVALPPNLEYGVESQEIIRLSGICEFFVHHEFLC